MKRYCCGNCGTVVIEGDEEKTSLYHFIYCPWCEHPESMNLMLEYETPEQWETRMGKPYPDNGLVWIKSIEPKTGYIEDWHAETFFQFKAIKNRKIGNRLIHQNKTFYVVIADPPVCPPEGFIP
jgi:DNA-directed RNA polymerase subunit RPC12/RpoP